MHGVREHPRHRGINKRSLGVIRPRRILQGSTTHACTIRLSKSRRATCASLAVLGPNRETIYSTAACQCKKLRSSGVRTSGRSASAGTHCLQGFGPCSRPAGLKLEPCRPQEKTIAAISPNVNPTPAQIPGSTSLIRTITCPNRARGPIRPPQPWRTSGPL